MPVFSMSPAKPAQRQRGVRHEERRVLRCAQHHPELRVLDWNGWCRSHPEWFQTDFIHLRPEGGARSRPGSIRRSPTRSPSSSAARACNTARVPAQPLVGRVGVRFSTVTFEQAEALQHCAGGRQEHRCAEPACISSRPAS
jgi:hypothetical protein